jgi:hypothetical protein
MKSCAYVVSQSTSSDGATLTIKYNFEQWVMSLKANEALATRAVELRQNYAKQFSGTTTGRANDLITNNNKVSWYPEWGAFYWVANGYLVIKVDQGKAVDSASLADPALDPCQTGAPLFSCTGLTDANCIKHVTLSMTSDVGDDFDNTFIDHAWVFNFMYFVVNTNTGGNGNTIFKLIGSPRDAGATGILSYSSYITSLSSNTQVLRLTSYPMYGFYMTSVASGTESLTSYVMNMQSTNSVYDTDGNGNYIEASAPTAINMDFTPEAGNGYTQRTLQQTGYMNSERAMYVIAGKSSDLVNYRNKAYWYTSNLNTPAKFTIDQTAQNSDARSLDFFQYNVTMQQYHFFTVMPGDPTDDIANTGSINYDNLKVSIVDLSSGYQDEVIRWELNGCGDGIYNDTQYSFEQCDKAAQPPNSPVDTYKYPAADNWLRKDVFYDTATRDYYTCSDICLR